ncbi:Aquaporin-1 [Fulvia fulva]|nr:Aquaporin-1 [Fulvia fulva]KAK4629814.1 Aquaporin-1 [Fulvia fulva]WPV27403.1 Aquaporin-1 [Fulvia fulva]
MGPPRFDQPFAGYAQPRDPGSQNAARNHFIAATGEFVGTFMFLLFAFLGHTMAVDQAPDTAPNGANSSMTVIYIAMAYGFSLLVTAWTMFRVSGGLFNPAVTIGLSLSGQLPWTRALIFLPTQLLAAICAAAVCSGIIPGDIATVQTTLASNVGIAQGLFLEMFLTAELTSRTYIAPVGIGLALFVAEIAGVYYTGGALNPARSFGPCVAGASFQEYHWIYWVGPYLGAMIAAGYYHFVKFFNYEEANPGQDSADGKHID